MTDRAPNMVFRPENIPIRFFKACRWCRRQKMRCDARDQVPCFRCRSAGRNCILDPIDSEPRRSRRRQKSATPARCAFRIYPNYPNIEHILTYLKQKSIGRLAIRSAAWIPHSYHSRARFLFARHIARCWFRYLN